jgi:hypothetical protein
MPAVNRNIAILLIAFVLLPAGTAATADVDFVADGSPVATSVHRTGTPATGFTVAFECHAVTVAPTVSAELRCTGDGHAAAAAPRPLLVAAGTFSTERAERVVVCWDLSPTHADGVRTTDSGCDTHTPPLHSSHAEKAQP